MSGRGFPCRAPGVNPLDRTPESVTGLQQYTIAKVVRGVANSATSDAQSKNAPTRWATSADRAFHNAMATIGLANGLAGWVIDALGFLESKDLERYLKRYNTERPQQRCNVARRTLYARFKAGLPKLEKAMRKEAKASNLEELPVKGECQANTIRVEYCQY